MNELVTLNVSSIDEHPQNFRFKRDDIIEQISNQLNGTFPEEHAIIVRPVGDRFQIISGHHRYHACQKSEITEIPAWVKEFTDEEAYMQLLLCNSQGETTPLERGIHALNCETLSKGGRGNKGGLSAYAETLGVSEATVRQIRGAAEIVGKVVVDYELCTTKTQQLYHLTKLPEHCWQDAVDLMLKKKWSAKDTATNVKNAKEGKTDKQVGLIFLEKTTIAKIERVEILKQSIREYLSEHEEFVEIWDKFCEEERDCYDIKVFQEERIQMEDMVEIAKEAERAAMEDEELTAEEERIAALPQLVLADPPWKYEHSKSDSRQIENQYPTADIDDIISHKPETQPDCILILWAVAPKIPEAIEVMQGWGFEFVTSAVWDKEKIGMGYWFRGQHEIIMVGRKGKTSPPDVENRTSSVFREKRSEHSKKPNCVYEWIEKSFPELNKLEMYCRSPRGGWEVFGNESA